MEHLHLDCGTVEHEVVAQDDRRVARREQPRLLKNAMLRATLQPCSELRRYEKFGGSK